MVKIQNLGPEQNATRIRTLRVMQICAVIGDLAAAVLFLFVLPAIGFQLTPMIRYVSGGGFIIGAIVIYFVIDSLIKKCRPVDSFMADDRA